MEEAWDPMTGGELAAILGMPAHANALQAALDRVRHSDRDCAAEAAALLAELGVDPAAPIVDAITERATTRLEVLVEELTRARYEEG